MELRMRVRKTCITLAQKNDSSAITQLTPRTMQWNFLLHKISVMVVSWSAIGEVKLLRLLFFGAIVSGAAEVMTLCPTSDLQTLKLLVSLPFPENTFPEFNPSWNEGDRILPALFLAQDQVNNRTDLLPCHRLELVSVNGGCDIVATTSINAVIGLFNKDKSRAVGMVGPGCSVSSMQTGNILNQPEINLVHVHGGGSLLLSDRSKFTNSLGILGSTQSYRELSLTLMKTNGWHNVAILFESGRIYYTSAKDDFVQALNADNDYNVTIRFESAVYSTFYPLDGVRNSLSRIIFLFTELYHAQRILCLAFHEGLFYPAYQWVIFDHRLHEILSSAADNVKVMYQGQNYTCTPSEILNVCLEATFLLYHQLSLNDSRSDLTKFANISFGEFLDLYEDRARSNNVSTSPWAYSFYDAVWAWARVLHQLMMNNHKIFDDFEYGNKTVASLVLEHFYASDFQFEGMSGYIAFNPISGFFDRPVNLYQITGGKEMHIAYRNGSQTVLKINDDTLPMVVSDIVQEDKSVSPIFIAIFAVLQFTWFFVLAAFHVLTAKYRNSKPVKASDPKLSHFAFGGAYLLVFALQLYLFLQVREHPENVAGPICQIVWVWMLPMGFTLLIGTVIVRSWRLYRIFIHYLDPGRFVSNTALIVMLLVLLSVDVVVAVIGTSIDPWMVTSTKETIQNGAATELVVIRSCRSQYGVWKTILVLYKVALLVAMVTLTLLTHHNIPNKTFTTASLRVFSFSFSFFFGLGFTLYILFFYLASARFRVDRNFTFSLLYVTTNITLFLSILFLFGPPLLSLARGEPLTKTVLQQLFKLKLSRKSQLKARNTNNC